MRTLLSLLLALCFCVPHAVQAEGRMPSLCKPDEVVLANARVQRVGGTASSGALAERSVSLCADREGNQIGKLVYRFGTPNVVEAEIVATSQRKAGVYFQSDEAAHVGITSIVFYAKPYSYVVSEGFGMANIGLRLSVYKRAQRIAVFSSLDYESNLVTIDPDAPMSPIFKRVQPIEPL